MAINEGLMNKCNQVLIAENAYIIGFSHTDIINIILEYDYLDFVCKFINVEFIYSIDQ